MLFGIRGIEESSVYQDVLRTIEAQAEGYAIALAEGYAEDVAWAFAVGYAEGYAEGRIEEARTILIHHGRKKFGPLDQQAEARIAALGDLDRLEDLIRRVPDIATWDDLLAPLRDPD
jgi:hypothetical protein